MKASKVAPSVYSLGCVLDDQGIGVQFIARVDIFNLAASSSAMTSTQLRTHGVLEAFSLGVRELGQEIEYCLVLW
jgi:hypothetical protein